jgi:hypothetical protein
MSSGRGLRMWSSRPRMHGEEVENDETAVAAPFERPALQIYETTILWLARWLRLQKRDENSGLLYEANEWLLGF